jgi:hypothetical protein
MHTLGLLLIQSLKYKSLFFWGLAVRVFCVHFLAAFVFSMHGTQVPSFFLSFLHPTLLHPGNVMALPSNWYQEQQIATAVGTSVSQQKEKDKRRYGYGRN